MLSTETVEPNEGFLPHGGDDACPALHRARTGRRNRFPEVIVYEDLVTFFTLSEHHLERMPRYSAPHNRLGYALQLCALRFMGFVPDDLSSTPPEAVAFVARQLTPFLTKDRKQWLDTLLQPDSTRGLTPLSWLRRPAVSNSPRAILGNLEKLAFLRNAGVEEWSLETLNPNRLKFLAQVARKSGAQTLQRAPAKRRYPVLIAFLYQALADVTDEVIERFDRCLAEAYARAGQDLEDFRKAMADATNEKVHLFREIARAVLDPTIGDPHLRSAIYQRIGAPVQRDDSTGLHPATLG